MLHVCACVPQQRAAAYPFVPGLLWRIARLVSVDGHQAQHIGCCQHDGQEEVKATNAWQTSSEGCICCSEYGELASSRPRFIPYCRAACGVVACTVNLSKGDASNAKQRLQDASNLAIVSRRHRLDEEKRRQVR